MSRSKELKASIERIEGEDRESLVVYESVGKETRFLQKGKVLRELGKKKEEGELKKSIR